MLAEQTQILQRNSLDGGQNLISDLDQHNELLSVM